MPKMTINVFFVKWYKGIINFQILFISSKYHEFWLSYEWFSCLNYQSLPKKGHFQPQQLWIDGKNFLWFWTIFCPFTPLKTQKIKILKKWKKTPGDIILQMCTINYNHMMYDSWDIEGNRQNFCQFGQFFAYLPPKNPKNQNFENHMVYYSYAMVMTDIIIFHFELFFAFLSPPPLP